MVLTAYDSYLSNFKLDLVTPDIGIQVTGIDLEKESRKPEFIGALRELLAEYLVVYIPGQEITPATIEYIPAQLGPLVDIKRAGNVAHHVPGYDWIKVISNGIAPDGVNYGDGNNSAQIWHSDSTPWEAPVGYIAFCCQKAPDPAPRTYFKNMIEVYAALPEETKKRINQVRVIHHFYPRQIEVKIHAEGKSMPLEDRKLGFTHPLVRRHLPTGKPLLYLPTRRDSLVQGMKEEQGRKLLTELWDFTNSVDFQLDVAMQEGDFVIWDNSATVHSREGWPNEQVRLMWHVSAEGEVPVPFYPRRSINTIGLSPEEARAAMKRRLALGGDY